MIKIFDENETSFITNGLGSIEPLKCLETKRKSLNGWEVEVEVDSRFKELIMQDRIIYIETKEKGGQPFRINNPAYSNHKISFTARHIGFDCERYVLDDVRPTNLPCVAYLNWINDRTDTKSPFSFYSNISKMATSYFVRKTLLEALEEAEEVFGGVYDLNHYEISLKTSVGNDNGFTIIYGKNLQEAKAIEDWSNVCTKVMPVGPDGLLLPEKYILSDIQYPKPYSRVIEFSLDSKKEDGTDKTEQELIIELRQMAKNYIENNKYPRVNYTVKSDVNQDLSIGDIIHVKSPAFMIDTEVQSYVYNVLTKKVIQLEFGNYTRSVKAVFDGIKDSIENATKETNNLIQHQTDLINRLNKEGLVYIDDNEILFLDKLPKEKAKNVWRFGLGGLGFSSNGYNGPFELAITQDGKINANFIMTGILKAIVVDGVTLKGVIGEIAGFTIGANGFTRSVETKLKKVYTQADADKAIDIILSGRTPTKDELYYYDLDNNGYISSWDALFISDLLAKIGSDTLITEVIINPKPLAIDGVSDVNSPAISITYKGKSGTVACSTKISARNINTRFGRFESVNSRLLNDCGSISLIDDENKINTEFVGRVYGSTRGIHLDSSKGIYVNSRIPVTTSDNKSGVIYLAYFDGTKEYLEITTKNGIAYGVDIWESDSRLKKNIINADISALSVLREIQHHEFDWIKGGHVENGYVAQELELINDRFVLKVPQNPDKSGLDYKYQINSSAIIPYLSKSIQELDEIVKRQQKEIDELKKLVKGGD